MRTIEFRGKRTDNGEWVYGDLTKLITPEGNVGYFIITENKGDFRDDVPVNSISYTLYNDIFLVLQSSVGQFTGLHDDFNKVGQGKVEFLEKWGVWYIGTTINDGLFDVNYNSYIEVIGNVYDNFDLLQL